jgi:glutathione S-transferase
MLLHVWTPSPNARRVRMYLAEKNLSVPAGDAGEGAQLSDKYKAKYPFAMVPMLELDDGTKIGEAMAICRYFEALHVDPPLMGTTPKEAAVIEMWERRAYDEGMIGVAEVFRNTNPLFADRGLPGYADPVPQVNALANRGRQRVQRFFQMFDSQLAESEFVVGSRISVADITALCAIDFAKYVQVTIPSGYSHLHTWYEKMSARSSAKA